MESISASSEQIHYGADNTTSDNILSPIPSGFSLFQPSVAIGFSLLVLVVLARVFGAGKQRLPAGVKRLPHIGPQLPYVGAPWGVPGPGIEAAWFFGNMHKKLGPIYEWKVRKAATTLSIVLLTFIGHGHDSHLD